MVGVAGKKRESGRELADFCAVYGFCPFSLAPAGWIARLWAFLTRTVPQGGYYRYVSLVAHISRVRLQQSVAVGKGVQSYHSLADLGPEWADAVAQDPAEVDAILGASQQQRASARARRGR